MPKTANPGRLEAFSDGVIAVIITIMVLDLKVPTQAGAAGFHAILPSIWLYALSFTFTGVYWVNHHHLVHRTDQADESTLYANLFFLFWLSLIPFGTSYVAAKKMDPFSVMLYIVMMIFAGASFGLLRLVIGRHLRATGRLEKEDAAAERKHLISLGVYLVAVACSFRYPRVSLGIVTLISVIWIIPSAKLHTVEHGVDAHATTREGIREEQAGRLR